MTGALAREVLFGASTRRKSHLDPHPVQRAASHVFQSDSTLANDYATIPERRMAGSSLTKYVAMERRQGLAAMGQRLLRGMYALFPQR